MFASTTSQTARQLEAMAATTLASTNTNSTMLGNPIFVEHDKETNSKPIVINGTQGVTRSFSGNGTIKGLDFTSHGMFLVLFKPDRFSDIRGQAIITIKDGDKGNYTFQSVGLPPANGIIKNSGAMFFHTTSTARLAPINNMVVIFKNQADQKTENATSIGWEWK